LLPEGSVETLPSWNRSPIEYILRFSEAKYPIVGTGRVTTDKRTRGPSPAGKGYLLYPNFHFISCS
jgi:hypothetical protein